MAEKQFDTTILTDKEIIRKNIRNALSDRLEVQQSELDSNMNMDVFTTIEDPLQMFMTNFLKAGGRIARSYNTTFIPILIQHLQCQAYGTILSTSSFFDKYLDKYGIRYVNTVNPNEPADVALVVSTTLIARSGSVGFMQALNMFPSVRNLAKTLIIVSRERCVFPDMEDVLLAQSRRDPESPCPLMEFICPSEYPQEGEEDAATPSNPKMLLMLVSDHEAPNEEPAR